MSLVDPGFEAELTGTGSYGVQTLAFVKKALKGILYLQFSAASMVLSGQVKNGDGTNHAAETLVLVRVIGLGTIAVTSGDAQAGDGTAEVVVKTLSTGAFSVTVTPGLGDLAAVATPSGGISTVIVLT